MSYPTDNNTNESKERKKDNCNEIVWVYQIIKDILCNISFTSLLVVILLSLFISCIWCPKDYDECKIHALYNDAISLFSTLLGFTIAGYAIILNLREDIVSKMSNEYKLKNTGTCLERLLIFLVKNHNPYDILVSSFSFCCIMLTMTIVSLILSKNGIIIYSSLDCMHKANIFLISCCILLVFDLFFHLYSVSTYIHKHHNKK